MPPRLAGELRFRFEDEDVARARRLQLDEAVLPVDLDGAEDVAVELRRAIDVANRHRHVRQAEGLDHQAAYFCRLYMTRQILPLTSSAM